MKAASPKANQEAQLLSSSGQLLGTLTMQELRSPTDVIARLRLEPGAANVPELLVLRELAEAADDLAIAAMAHIEQRLVALGMVMRLQTRSVDLNLVRDFWGLVITEGGTQIAFELAAPLQPRDARY